MGISRAPAVIIGYLMKKNDMTFGQAYNYVKTKRIVIAPNKGFI